jgi:hypothetical protein
MPGLQLLPPLEEGSEELAWLQRTFPPCVARHIMEAVSRQPHFTILVLQDLASHKVALLQGEQIFQLACRHLAAMYAFYLGRQTCLQGAPQPFFHEGEGRLRTVQLEVQQYWSAAGGQRCQASCVARLQPS